MTSLERQNLINQWRAPSSLTEKDSQDRAERMVKDAVAYHQAFSAINPRVFPKGSYANNTNVKLDSDVDIVVECDDVYFHSFLDPAWGTVPSTSPYAGIWTPAYFRQEVTAALVNYFGASEVQIGDVALTLKEKTGSRPSVDIVPAFRYVRYDAPDLSVSQPGNKIFKKTTGELVNWPDQQLSNGRSKNVDSGTRYKDFVRVLKRAENYLVGQGVISELPSYLMECLIWNVPNSILNNGTLEQDFGATLRWLWLKLTESYVREEWVEPNRLKYLFHNSQKWTVEDAKKIVLETWKLMGYS